MRDVGDFGFSGSDGMVDDHTSMQETRVCEMLSGRAISDVIDQLAEMEAKYAGSVRRKLMPPSLMGRVA